MRLTIDEYSKHFKMSKEMINSKIRAKRLNYIIENNQTFIIVTKSFIKNPKSNPVERNIKKIKPTLEKEEAKVLPKKVLPKAKTTVAMIISLYQKENLQLKEKITQLEQKVDKLIDDKEQMLRDEMNKIEQVYSAKDEQLKNILELINSQLNHKQVNTIHEVETLNEKKNLDDAPQIEIIELKEYLKTLDLEAYQRKIIKKRFMVVYDSDIRIIKQNGKLFLDFSKYDYSDLLEY